MSTEQQSSFSSTISVNPYTNEYVSSVSNFLAKVKSPEYSKDQFVCSYLNTRSYIDNQIEISRNIPEEDIADVINVKIYDELGLDQAVEYQVRYFETFNNIDESNRSFQVFIVDPLDIPTTFENVLPTIKYIDDITPAPLLIKSLYTKEIIEDHGIHCFIYFEENDAFLTIYNDKEFVYTKSLKYSLTQMHERFCEIYGERVDYTQFVDFLSTQNLKYTESEYKSYILKLYREIFANINDILTYAKKAFNIEKVEHIYIGSEVEIASKLYEISEVELSIASNDFEFQYGFESDGTHINQIHALMHLNASIPEEEKYSCNFTKFHRPPKFAKRESGKILMLLAASLVIAFAYPVTYWTLTYMKSIEYDMLSDTYKEVHTQKTTRDAIIKSREADKVKALALLKKEKDNYTAKKNTLIKIHDVKVNYPIKAKLIAELSKDLNKYSVELAEILYDQKDEKKKFNLSLVSLKDKQITHLLEYLTKKYDNVFKFSLENITYKDATKNYLSELKVELL